MNKPDWKDAPEWANYLAMDGGEYWYWYESKPKYIGSLCWKNTSGKMEKANTPDCKIKPEESLEKRPTDMITDCKLTACSLNEKGTCVSTNKVQCKTIPDMFNEDKSS